MLFRVKIQFSANWADGHGPAAALENSPSGRPSASWIHFFLDGRATRESFCSLFLFELSLQAT